MQTPLVYGDYLYVCRDNGVLSVYDAKTGERKYQQRLADGKTGFTASAVAADGKVYYTSEEGGVYVIKAGPVFELLAENSLGEVAMATPAISEGVLVLPDPRPPRRGWEPLTGRAEARRHRCTRTAVAADARGAVLQPGVTPSRPVAQVPQSQSPVAQSPSRLVAQSPSRPVP